MIFDTHAHYDSGAFNADREELLASMPSKGVGLILDPGCEERSSRAALALAEKFPFVYAAVGVHPEDMEGMSPETLETIRALARHEKCVAIGEIGLDYYWDASHKTCRSRRNWICPSSSTTARRMPTAWSCQAVFRRQEAYSTASPAAPRWQRNSFGADGISASTVR